MAALVDGLGRRPGGLVALCLALVCAVGAADLATGYEISLSLFYLIPVCLAAWYAGWSTGAALAAVSAVVWGVADRASGHVYSHAGVMVWNAFVRLGFFLQSAYLVSRVRDHLRAESRRARLDSHTGALNARGFYEAAGPLLALSQRTGSPLTLLYIDLDDFKAVNDGLGHLEGDRVLKLVGETLRGSLRRSDIVGRLGGDEFAIVLPETNDAGTRVLVDQIRERVATRLAGCGPVTFSPGALTLEGSSAGLDEAVSRADQLMYESKRAGKNRATFATLGDGAAAS